MLERIEFETDFYIIFIQNLPELKSQLEQINQEHIMLEIIQKISPIDDMKIKNEIIQAYKTLFLDMTSGNSNF